MNSKLCCGFFINCFETKCLVIFVLDTKNLQERETWSIDTDDERGGTTTLVSSMLVYIIAAVQ